MPGQAEFGADRLQTTHQNAPLVRPLLDRAKRMLDCLAPLVEDVRTQRDAGRFRAASFSRRDTVRNCPAVHRERIVQSSHASLLEVDLVQPVPKRR
jgi:hypothetical protein